ncbi:MAG: LysM peptidoglycan-binding domain-containing protein [Anaerolineales bacterium]|nr:LysM peptidoglycan-binding domain-containing protein [Anaerolineales bacterium]
MFVKKITQTLIVFAILFSAFAFTGSARAWSCSSTVTVQWGDTLSSIARICGTTVAAIQAANPGLGTWIYAGQTLYIPTGYPSDPVYYPPVYGGTYVVQKGDTLFSIARSAGSSVSDLLAANPTIWNASYIYAGQVISIPAAPVYYTIQSGDTLRIIAGRYGTTVSRLQSLNPQIYNVNWIYTGQIIRVS